MYDSKIIILWFNSIWILGYSLFKWVSLLSLKIYVESNFFEKTLYYIIFRDLSCGVIHIGSRLSSIEHKTKNAYPK